MEQKQLNTKVFVKSGNENIADRYTEKRET